MKRTLLIAALLAGCTAFGETAQAAQRSYGLQAHYGAFYQPLAGHGQWIEVEPGLVVWRPVHVRPGWRPYLEGRWVWTDYGWYWVSHEPFGWAVFHYGRWYYDDYYGWVWMPDDVWGPAWVEWRYNDAYIGWAPLPPYASFHITFGIRFTRTWFAPAHYWSFVDFHRFGGVTRYRDYADVDHTRRLIGTTRNGSGYEIDRNRVVNRGVDRSFVEQRTGGRIDRTEIRASGTNRGERMGRDADRREVVETYRPSASEFGRADVHRNIQRGERRLDLEMNNVERPQRTHQEMDVPRREEQAAPTGRTTQSQEGRETYRRPEFTRPQQEQRRQPAVRDERRTEPGKASPQERTAPRVSRPSSPSPSRKRPERATSPAPSRREPSAPSTADKTRRRN